MTLSQTAPVDPLQITSLVASIVSVILGLFAIALSIIFYRMALATSEQTKEAAKTIASGVQRLESLFEKLYTGTFTMMKDTVDDMRKHIWPPEAAVESPVLTETALRADEKIEQLRVQVSEQLSGLITKQTKVDENVGALTQRVKQVLNTAITESRKVDLEARTETLRTHLLKSIRTLLDANIPVAAQMLTDSPLEGFTDFDTVRALRELIQEKLIASDTPYLERKSLLTLP